MNRSLFLSAHAFVALALVVGVVSWGVLADAASEPASASARDFVFWSGWVALVAFLAAYAYVLRKRALKLGYSPEFGMQVSKEAMEAAQQRLGALRDKVAARQLQDKGQILAAARTILRETGCSKVLVARVVAGEGGTTRLETRRAEPLSRMARWLHAHLYYGVAACALAFLHGGGRFDTPMSIAINSLVLLVLASGVVGIFLWAWGPGWLTREERDLSIEVHAVGCHLASSSSRSSEAWSTMASPASSLLMRLVSPARTLPGPHSMTWVTPSAANFCTVSTQRTGLAAWRTSASLIAAGSVTIATSTLLISGTEGALNWMPAM